MHEAGYIKYEGEVTTLAFPMFRDMLPVPWLSRANIESYIWEFMNGRVITWSNTFVNHSLMLVIIKVILVILRSQPMT